MWRCHMENNNWVLQEISTVNFGDKRLDKRFSNILSNIAANPEASIPQACADWKETKGLYRFLSNPKVNTDKILQPHIDATISRIKNERTVLMIQDTTEIDYTSHKSVEDLGVIGTKVAGYKNMRRGIYLHSTIAVTPAKNCLGVFDYLMWTRDPEKILGRKNCSKKSRPIEEKESNRWLDSFRNIKALAQKLPDTKIINVADRESDIFELFVELEHDIPNVNMIVRASINRNTEITNMKLFDVARNGNCLSTIEFELPRGRNNSKPRVVKQEVRAAEVTLKCPKRYSPKLPNVKLNIILATETDPPKGETPIEWMLLTDIDITSAEDAEQIIKYYLCRWQIELYFKTTIQNIDEVEKIQELTNNKYKSREWNFKK